MRALELVRSTHLEERFLLGLAAALRLGVEDLLELLREPGAHPLALGRAKVVVPASVARRLGGRQVDFLVTVRVRRSHMAKRAALERPPSSATGQPSAGGRSEISWFM